MAPLPPPANQTVTAIYRGYEQARRDERRPHLGASVLGRECDRELWYIFRWATKAEHAGRLLRLFARGDLEEPRLIEDLRRIGVTVLDLDPDTGKQWDVRDLGEHFGGSMDAVALGVLEAPKTWHLLEFKTHNAKSFAKLLKDGVQQSKPEHWAQMQTYMHLAGLERALYLACNKDTDELYQERIHADAAAAIRLIERARRIIFAARPPARISEDPAFFKCRFCDHRSICHEGNLPEVNCRTCIHSSPLEAGGWQCERWNKPISTEEQRVGCPNHLMHPDLVPGEQIDAGADWIEYRMPDGTTWRDGFSPVLDGESPEDEELPY